MNAKLQTETFVVLQSNYKTHLTQIVPNKNSVTTYLCASRHLLLFCEKQNQNQIARISLLIPEWEQSLTQSLVTYKKHVQNRFLPYLATLTQPEPAPQKKPRTRSSCPHCQKEMLKKCINRHLRICRAL